MTSIKDVVDERNRKEEVESKKQQALYEEIKKAALQEQRRKEMAINAVLQPAYEFLEEIRKAGFSVSYSYANRRVEFDTPIDSNVKIDWMTNNMKEGINLYGWDFDIDNSSLSKAIDTFLSDYCNRYGLGIDGNHFISWQHNVVTATWFKKIN